MAYYLVENPWPIAGLLGLIALVFLILLKTTQDGRFAVRIAGVLGILGAFLLFEQLWVTENERIEAVVYELGRAMAASDGDRVSALFAPEISIGVRNRSELVQVDPSSFRETLKSIKFDWLRITKVATHAGLQTRQGTAEFRVNASGSIQTQMNFQANFATGASDWSIGLRKMPDGEWKVTRINPVSMPSYALQTVENYINRITRRNAPGAPPNEFVGPPRPRPGLQGRGSITSPRMIQD